jgi:hypothetical protein
VNPRLLFLLLAPTTPAEDEADEEDAAQRYSHAEDAN